MTSYRGSSASRIQQWFDLTLEAIERRAPGLDKEGFWVGLFIGIAAGAITGAHCSGFRFFCLTPKGAAS